MRMKITGTAIIPTLLLCGRDIKAGSGCIAFSMPRDVKHEIITAREKLATLAPMDLWTQAMAAQASDKGEIDDHWGRVKL